MTLIFIIGLIMPIKFKSVCMFSFPGNSYQLLRVQIVTEELSPVLKLPFSCLLFHLNKYERMKYGELILSTNIY